MNKMRIGRVKASVQGPGLKSWESSRQPVGKGGRLPQVQDKNKCKT